MIFFLILSKIRDILITVFVFFEQKMNIIRMIVHNMKQIDFLTKIEEVVFVYESLLEIFYKNRNEYNKICEERLSNDKDDVSSFRSKRQENVLLTNQRSS